MSCIDVLFVKQQERFTGEAFVILPSPSQVEISLAKNKSYLGRRYVEVFRASKLVRAAGPPAARRVPAPAITPQHPHPRCPRPSRRTTTRRSRTR